MTRAKEFGFSALSIGDTALSFYMVNNKFSCFVFVEHMMTFKDDLYSIWIKYEFANVPMS